MSTLKRFSAPVAITLVVAMAFAVSACAQNCQAYDPISLSVTPSEKTVCVGETVTMTLTASDGDYCGDPPNCWDNLTFSGWPGDTPIKDGQGVYNSTYNRQYDSPGTHTYNVYTDDTGRCYNEVDPPGIGPHTITIKVIEPQITLTATGSTTRGEVQTVTATVTPSEQEAGITYIYIWKATGEGGHEVLKIGGTAWAGTIVVPTSIELLVGVVGLACPRSKSINLTVTPRSWVDNFTKNIDTPTNTPPCPQKNEDLGKCRVACGGDIYPPEEISSGPNEGYLFIANAVLEWDNHLWRHSALNSPGHPFYEAQGSPYCTAAQLKENVEIHEGIASCACHTSHWQQGKDFIDQNPVLPWVEDKISHVANETKEEFHARIGIAAQARVDAVCSAAKSEPTNHYSCGTNFTYQCP